MFCKLQTRCLSSIRLVFHDLWAISCTTWECVTNFCSPHFTLTLNSRLVCSKSLRSSGFLYSCKWLHQRSSFLFFLLLNMMYSTACVAFVELSAREKNAINARDWRTSILGTQGSINYPDVTLKAGKPSGQLFHQSPMPIEHSRFDGCTHQSPMLSGN